MKHDTIIILVLLVVFVIISTLGIMHVETLRNTSTNQIDDSTVDPIVNLQSGPTGDLATNTTIDPTVDLIVDDLINDQKTDPINDQHDTRDSTGEDSWNEQMQYVFEESRPGPSGISGIVGGVLKNISPHAMMDSAVSSEGSIGLAVGGANDINNFRQNVNSGYLPSVYDITYDGIFYDYYFKPVMFDCDTEFCPAYDSWDAEDSRYVSVGLTSGIEKSEFDRDGLDIVIVLDVSGSMSTSFDRYYYDRANLSRIVYPVNGSAVNPDKDENYNLSKIDVAKKALIGLVDNLDDRDRLGVVLFNNDAHVAKPLEYVSDLDIGKLTYNIKQIIADGGTNMEDGYLSGIELFDDETFNSKRIIFLTDAMPNVGASDSRGLSYIAKTAEKSGIHTTMIGIGVDFQSELVRDITDIRGGNYYSVHSADEFIDRMDTEFAYMVTPIVYDLRLFTNVDAEIYGATGAQDGDIFLIKTLFPSESSEDGNKGGVILLKTESGEQIMLTATYTRADGSDNTVERVIQFDGLEPPGTGLAKAVLLKDYVDLMHGYIDHMTRDGDDERLSEWERQSIPLTIDSKYAKKIQKFMIHFEKQIVLLGDETLSMELDIMQKILDSKNSNYLRDDDNSDTWISP